MADERHPSLDELLGGAIRTLEDVIIPEIQAPWPRASAIQLAGLLTYALQREKRDLQAEQDIELRALVGALAAEFPAAPVPGDTTTRAGLRAHAGDLLVYAQRAAAGDAAAQAIRERLRPVVGRQTDNDLAESSPLLQGFMSGFRSSRANADA